SYVCPVDDAAEPFVVGMVVAPDDVPADHAGLFLVAGVVGGVQREGPPRGGLRLDAGLPGRIGRGVGGLDVVGLRPGPDPGVFARGQVRAEVVADDRDPDRWRIQSAQVAAELQEPGPGLARLDVPVQLVLAQLVGGEQVPDPGGPGIGGAHPVPRRAAWFPGLAADRGPLPPGPGLQVQGPELVNAEYDLRVAGLRRYVPVGDRVQLLDPRLL